MIPAISDLSNLVQNRLSVVSLDSASSIMSEASGDTFLEEVDEWISKIVQQLKDLEERHQYHLNAAWPAHPQTVDGSTFYEPTR
ncbi:hypothetical protein PM082_021583 [Marasmius tenuissimus]|nr:hypothetical protein PM082_021583 [Marasmius tenuissimus]